MRSGPFGLWMGMSLNDFASELVQTGEFSFTTSVVPKMHSAFHTYILLITPLHGLAKIIAIGTNIDTQSNGFNIINKFNDLRLKLEKNYGEHKIYDFLMADSIWNESNEWMTALKKEERSLSALWADEFNSSLYDSLNAVILEARACDENTGYLVLSYEFENWDNALQLINSIEDDAL